MTERIAEGAKIRRQSAVTVINSLRSRRGDRSTLAGTNALRTTRSTLAEPEGNAQRGGSNLFLALK
jgi:hypothetical protein